MGYKVESARIAEAALNASVKYEFTDLSLTLARILLGHHAINTLDIKKQNELDKLIEKLNYDMNAELAAERAYYFLSHLWAKSQRSYTNADIKSYTNDYNTNLDRYRDCDTRRFLRLSYLFKVCAAELSCNNKDAILLCKEALRCLESRPYVAPGFKNSFIARLITNSLKLGDVTSAESLATSQVTSLAEGGPHWYLFTFYTFILYCHQREYSKAAVLSTNVLSNTTFKQQRDNLKQLWIICHAFSELFKATNYAAYDENVNNSVFRIYKFLNEVPLYSKDKRGMNISILIIHVMFLIWKKKYLQADDRIESLKAYSRKYLYDDSTFRSNCFIKMLIDLSKADFHPIRGATIRSEEL